jgi:hypothetical protein
LVTVLPFNLAQRLPEAAGFLTRKIVDGASLGLSRTARLIRRPDPDQPIQYLEVNLGLDNVDLAQLVERLKVKTPFALSGKLTIQAQIAVPYEVPENFKAYRLRGTATLPNLNVAGLEMTSVKARVSYENGVLHLDSLTGQLPPLRSKAGPGTFSGSARYQVIPQGDFTAKLEIERVDISRALAGFPDTSQLVDGAFSGVMEVAASAGRLDDWNAWKGQGSLHSERLRLVGLNVQDVAAKVSLEAGIKLQDIRARLYQGELTGTAIVSLGHDLVGNLDLRIKEVDAAALSRDVTVLPVKVEGLLSGALTGQLKRSGGQPGGLAAHLQFQAPSLRIQGIAAERISGTLDHRAGVTEYHLEGDTLGGRFKINGKFPPPGAPAPASKPGAMHHLQLDRARLSRLWDLLDQRARLGSLEGLISLDLPFQIDAKTSRPVGKGRLRISGLRWAGADLATPLEGDLDLSPTEVQLRNLTGEVAQGLLRAQIAYSLRDSDRSWFSLSLEHADLGRLLQGFPGVTKWIEGSLQVSLRGQLGREWHGGGTLALTRGKIRGIEIVEWLMPLQFMYSPRTENGQLDIHDSTAQVGQGRANGQATIHWGPGIRLEGSLRFSEARLGSLFSGSEELSSLAGGRATGRIDFGGHQVQSVNDLTAVVSAQVHQSQALLNPILRSLLPYLGLGISVNTTFQRGDLTGRLAHGIFRVQRLTLSSPSVQMVLTGTVSLQDRLDLEVTAHTGVLVLNPALVRLLNLPLPSVGPIPVTLLVQATYYLSNQVVHLRVTGTLRSPVIRIEPVQLLTEEAVRFFLNRANVPVP